MEERLKLNCDNMAKEVNTMQYQHIVGSLRYLIHTRPDLAFIVGYISRFMQQPMMEHLHAVKRILCYIEGTSNYDLHYLKCTGMEHFIGYSDSILASDIDIRWSTSLP